MPEWMKKMVATGELGIEGTEHIRREDTFDVDYARLLERAHARLSRTVDKGVASPSLPSWNQIAGFLESMRRLLDSSGFAA
jgi:hypothetical protein